MQKSSEPLPSAIIMVPYVRQAFLRTFGDFDEQQSFEAGQLQRFSLLLIQSRQALLNDRPPFPNCHSSPERIAGIRFEDFAFTNLAPIIKIPERKVMPAAQAS